jgi:hypothetical protein
MRETRCGGPMARPRPEKTRERKVNGQLPLLTSPAPVSVSMTRVLPMDLKIGDRLVDERQRGREECRRAGGHRDADLGCA